jgi:SAM-dependent methyltransferase
MNKAAPNSVDQINRRTMSRVVLEYSALVNEGLAEHERACLESVAPLIRNKRILDIGIGAGRTVAPLRLYSKDYIGVDYTPEMVAHCRHQYPSVRFAHVDARSMKTFADESFNVAFFSCNGISMVDHAGRLAILSEVRRVLAPDGIFIFSTCNRQSPFHTARFTLPEFQATFNPVKATVRAARFLAQTGFRAVNRLAHFRHEIECDEYAVVNDVCHHYRTMLYFISPEQQVRQLRSAQFTGELKMFGQSGQPADFSNTDGTIGFVVHKHAVK